MALLEFALPLLLVAALGLAIEDLWTAIQGGDSVIGDFLNQIYGTEKARQILDDLKKSFEDLKPVWEELKELGPLVLKGMIVNPHPCPRARVRRTHVYRQSFLRFVHGRGQGLEGARTGVHVYELWTRLSSTGTRWITNLGRRGTRP